MLTSKQETVLTVIVNHPDGLTVQELAGLAKLQAYEIRNITTVLVTRGLIRRQATRESINTGYFKSHVSKLLKFYPVA